MIPAVELPPLRDVISRHGLDARKSLGQHFLLDMNVTRRILRDARDLSQSIVLEVGPGPGGLTRALLEADAYVVAVERDDRSVAAVSELKEAYPDRLEIVAADALDIDEAALIETARVRAPERSYAQIASNLPYNISTVLLAKWLTAKPRFWDSMILMFQSEVADRIIAPKGGKSYGRLSVLAQTIAEASRVLTLPPRAFTPPPKVASTVLEFIPRDGAHPPLDKLEAVTKAAFAQRRKMLRASLKPLLNGRGVRDPSVFLMMAGVNPEARAEDLSIHQFHDLTRAIEELSQ